MVSLPLFEKLTRPSHRQSVNTTISLPGRQSSITCSELEKLAGKGKIDASQCGIMQGFVGQLCGCQLEEVADDASGSPAADTPSVTSGASRCASPILSSLPYLVAALATMFFSFLD